MSHKVGLAYVIINKLCVEEGGQEEAVQLVDQVMNE